jgi:hypothetical protein
MLDQPHSAFPGMLVSLKIAMILPNFPSFSCVSAAGGG